MPELPEVEGARVLVEKHCGGKRIVECSTVEDSIVYSGVSASAFAAAMRGRRVEHVRRKGKHLWFEMDSAPHPAFHFGMTGAFRVKDQPGPQYQRASAEPAAWPPRFCKCEFVFEDGTRLAFTNARRLGRIRLLADPAVEPPVGDLGFDALTELPVLAEFHKALSGRDVPIKALLLDQKFTAGVGNWVADEVLFHARVHPRSRAADLEAEHAARLHTHLTQVLRAAVAVGADSTRFPPHWLFHVRWGRQRKGVRTSEGHAVEFTTVAGRTTLLVPKLQKMARRVAAAAAAAPARALRNDSADSGVEAEAEAGSNTEAHAAGNVPAAPALEVEAQGRRSARRGGRGAAAASQASTGKRRCAAVAASGSEQEMAPRRSRRRAR